jgi:hypothetical protein
MKNVPLFRLLYRHIFRLLYRHRVLGVIESGRFFTETDNFCLRNTLKERPFQHFERPLDTLYRTLDTLYDTLDTLYYTFTM